MIFCTVDGRGVEVMPPLRRQDVIDSLITRLRDAGHTVVDIAAVLNRSREYVFRRLKVMRDHGPAGTAPAVPVFGADPHWSPDVECPHPAGSCRRCGGDVGPIEEGSDFVCLACLHSGRDRELRAALAAERAKERARRKKP